MAKLNYNPDDLSTQIISKIDVIIPIIKKAKEECNNLHTPNDFSDITYIRDTAKQLESIVNELSDVKDWINKSIKNYEISLRDVKNNISKLSTETIVARVSVVHDNIPL